MKYRIDPNNAVWKVIDGEAVVVHADSSEYFGLNATATALWQSLATSPATTEELGERLVGWFDQEAAAAVSQATSFVEQAHAGGLLAVLGAEAGEHPTDGEAATPADVAPPARTGPYEAPTLVKFGDLDALILSGE